MKITKTCIVATAFFVLAVTIAGCGANYQFKKARALENKKYYPQAAEKYIQVADKHPSNPLAPESLYRAGRIYQKQLKIYSKSTDVFARLIRAYSGVEPWSSLAKNGIFDSPDYFPLDAGFKWTEGDSETGGSNMRVESSCVEVTTGVYKVTRNYFAGARSVTAIVRYYKKADYRLLESGDKGLASPFVRIKYPFEAGSSWETESGSRKFRLNIEGTGLTIRVRAGEFSGCLKVRQEDKGFPDSYKYEYFAPGAGLILTTVGSRKSGSEHRNTELISYTPR
jgi:hypothetical protein